MDEHQFHLRLHLHFQGSMCMCKSMSMGANMSMAIVMVQLWLLRNRRIPCPHLVEERRLSLLLLPQLPPVRGLPVTAAAAMPFPLLHLFQVLRWRTRAMSMSPSLGLGAERIACDLMQAAPVLLPPLCLDEKAMARCEEMRRQPLLPRPLYQQVPLLGLDQHQDQVLDLDLGLDHGKNQGPP